jgi:hypothetical protein
MIKREVTIEGITYVVRATSEKGVDDGLRMLKRSLKRSKKEKEDNE